MYVICPDMLSKVGETSLGIWVGFIESDKTLSIFLFIYLFIGIWGFLFIYLYLRQWRMEGGFNPPPP